MRGGVVLLLMAAGCRQVFGLEAPERIDAAVSPDGMTDASDSNGVACVERWIGGPVLSAPAPLIATTPASEELPFVTADGSQLYYVRDNDIYASSSMGGTFGVGQRVEVLSSGNADGKVFVAPNETRAWFSSNRNGAMSGGSELWRATRLDVASAWTADQADLQNVSAPGDQTNPHLSPDLLRIYYAQRGTGIVVAERPVDGVVFGAPTRLATLAAPFIVDDDTPTLSADERVIVFASRRSGNWELWYAVRGVTGAFDSPMLVPTVNDGMRTDDGPHLSLDGCTLYFTSDRNGSRDIFVATLLE
jgi:hypothetical protein